MTMDLHFTNRAVDTEALATENWAAMTAIGEHGMVFLDADIVDSIARLLEGQVLSNGEAVTSYPTDEDADEYAMPSYVPAFGPSLLPRQEQDYIRDRLARGANGKAACRLFDEILARGLQVSFKGQETCEPYIKAVNWRADDVGINRCASTIHEILRDLGLGSHIADDGHGSGEVEFETFVKAVADFGDYAGTGAGGIHLPDRLEAFIAAGRRNQATHVYWS